MADYLTWNKALANYFTCGVSRGSRIYLGVDSDVLEYIGEIAFDSTPFNGSWYQDFLRAVRKQVVKEGEVNLKVFQQYTATKVLDRAPSSIAFLGATVLAAYKMAEEEDINQRNYFRRLREVLGLPLHQDGRPLGMEVGSEELLWIAWGKWLRMQGFLPSISSGKGSQKYIQYPISQSLLREVDKEKLCQLFSEKRWSSRWDSSTLFTQLRQEPEQRFSKHLLNLFSGNRQRHSELAEAIHELYEEFIESGYSREYRSTFNKQKTSKRAIFAGLYRVEDPFLGDIEYFLYPRQPRKFSSSEIQVVVRDRIITLQSERPGWYMPNLPISLNQLDSGIEYKIVDTPSLEKVILPSRDFWLLVPDPEDIEASVVATWGAPSLGEKFTLLCKESILNDVQRLRDEKLLEWYGDPSPLEGSSNWIELHQCMVISANWSGVFIQNHQLYEALYPTNSVSINISGGLRVPGSGAWISEHGPQLTVSSFYPTASLKITRLSNDRNDQLVLDKSIKTNQKISINWRKAGDYFIEAICGENMSERLVRIFDWGQLFIKVPTKREKKVIGSWEINGACLAKLIQTTTNQKR